MKADVFIFGFGVIVGFLAGLLIYGFFGIKIRLTGNGPGSTCTPGQAPNDDTEAVFYSVTLPENLLVGEFFYMELKEGQTATGSVALRTKAGHPARIEPGSARFTSSDESVVGVTQNPANELEFTIEGLDGSNNESALIEFRADGKIGEGTKDVVATLDVVCTQGDAVVAEISVNPPTDAAAAPIEQAPPETGTGGTPADTTPPADAVPPAPISETPADVPAETPAEVPADTTPKLSGDPEGEGNPSFPGPASPGLDPADVGAGASDVPPGGIAPGEASPNEVKP